MRTHSNGDGELDASAIEAVLARHHHDATRLMQILRETQDETVWLSPSTITAIAQGVKLPRARVQGVASNMNFGYHMKGPKEVWTPLRVFDDGSKTYLQMPPEMKSLESPALFVMEEKNAPELVNYRVKGDYYIVDRLFHLAQLRIGTKKFVTIYRDVRTGS